MFDSSAGEWKLAYTLQAGLNLGHPYTVSGSGDQGADPNKLVAITDPLGATSPAAGEGFRTVRAAGFGEVLRGVSFTPGSR